MRLIALSIFLIIGLSSGFSEEASPHDYSSFGIIDTSLNRLQLFGGQAKLDHVFSQLNSLAIRGEGRINILHLGDSHIQADYFSGKMRDHFSKFIAGGEASRGFIFPYTMAGTNNPANYKVWYSGEWKPCRNIQRSRSCGLGLSGASVTTNVPNSRLTINQAGGEHTIYGFDRVKIFHSISETSFVVRVLNNVKILSNVDFPKAGYTEICFDKRQDTLRLEFSQYHPTQTFFELHGISLETSEDGITYSATGINGADVPAWLACPLLGIQIASLDLDIIIVSLGTNDGYNLNFNKTTFYSKFDTLLFRIEQAAPKALIILTTPGDNFRDRVTPNENTELTNEIITELARKHQCALWDFYSAMGGSNSILLWQEKGLSANDRLHFSKAGYILQADMLFSAIMKEYDIYIDRTKVFKIPDSYHFHQYKKVNSNNGTK